MSMQSRIWTYWKTHTSFSLSLKCAAILLLFLLSVLIVACSSAASGGSTDLGNPQVTVTVHLGDTNGSPTPPLPSYWCGAWATQTSPAYYATSTVGIYAKFVHNVNQNPVGMGGATAVATVHWADRTNSTQTVTTSSDGLAVFAIPTAGRAADINTVTLVEVDFTASDGTTCQVNDDRQAFFTLIGASSGVGTATTPSANASPTGIAGPTSTCTPQSTPHFFLRRTPTPIAFPSPIPTLKPGC
jgi:hypothetical protein